MVNVVRVLSANSLCYKRYGLAVVDAALGSVNSMKFKFTLVSVIVDKTLSGFF
jgi:hypothetical protein